MYDGVDVETYLDDYHDMIIKTAVQESINQTLAECMAQFLWCSIRDAMTVMKHDATLNL